MDHAAGRGCRLLLRIAAGRDPLELSGWRMPRDPVRRDLFATANPDLLVAHDVIEKARERSREKTELQNLARPVRAILNDQSTDLSTYTENKLRDYRRRLAANARADPSALRVIHSVIIAFLRQKLR